MSRSKSEELQAIREMLEKMDFSANDKEAIVKEVDDSGELKIANRRNVQLKILFSELQINSLVRILNLSHNKIGSNGVEDLAEGLKSNTTLTSLNLYYNNIKDDIIQDLATALKGNTNLVSLNLGCNSMGNNGARALAAALEFNITLTSFSLSGNNIEVNGTRALAAALKGNTTLTSFDLSGNVIRDDEVKILAEAIRCSFITNCGTTLGTSGATNANKKRLAETVLYLKEKFIKFDFDQILENTARSQKKYIALAPKFDSFKKHNESGKVDFGGNLFI